MTTPAQTETQHGHFIHANGLNIYYQEHGQGQPLILIHGGILNSDSWQPYRDAFAQHYRVITPDSRGHGRTANPSGSMSFGLLADDVVALTQALDLQKPLICGYSDGGQVALEIGMRYPDLAQALVIGGAYTKLTEASRAWVQSMLGDPESPDVDIEQFERDNPDFATMLQQNHGPDAWKTLLRNIKPMWNALLNYATDDFARIKAPTLVLLGDRDGFVPVEEGIQMYRRLHHAEFAVIPGADHADFIFSPAKVALVQPLVLDFLRRHSNPISLQPTNRIRIVRHFVEPTLKLWQAWTDPTLIRLWFGSDPNGVVIQARLDVQVGGRFEVTFANADMTEFTCCGIYQEVEPNSKLVFSWSWKNTPDIEELVSVSFQEDRSGTLMTFEHANIDPNTSHGYEIGWSTTFDKLEKALKT